MRTYTKVGKEYEKEQINNAISRTEWETFRTTELPFMQGECIKAVIQQCHVPLSKITRMALHGFIYSNGEEHGFYALDVQYKNGQAQLYISDNGCNSCVVASDFVANELVPA
jgi:hypothetical protein